MQRKCLKCSAQCSNCYSLHASILHSLSLSLYSVLVSPFIAAASGSSAVLAMNALLSFLTLQFTPLFLAVLLAFCGVVEFHKEVFCWHPFVHQWGSKFLMIFSPSSCVWQSPLFLPQFQYILFLMFFHCSSIMMPVSSPCYIYSARIKILFCGSREKVFRIVSSFSRFTSSCLL